MSVGLCVKAVLFILHPADVSAVFILLLYLRNKAPLIKVILNESMSTAIPTPSQSSDEDIRLSIDIPSALDKLSVCISLMMSMLILRL